MKEKRSKKESIKKEPTKEGRIDSVFALSKTAASEEDLRIEWAQFIKFFNDTLSRHNSQITAIEWISQGMKRLVKMKAKQYGTKKVLVVAIDRMAKSDFLNGRNKKYQFKASFTWLFESDDHFERVLNGYYDNPPAAELTPEEQRQQELERYRAQQEARRAEARRIDEEEHERREREREQWARNCVTYEEYQRLKKMQEGPLPTSPKGGGENAKIKKYKN